MSDNSDELVLVTGASGYIGSHVVQQLQAAGYRVRGSVRDVNNEKRVAPLRNLCPEAKHPLQLVKGDLLDETCWNEATEGCTYVMHVASPFTLINPTHEDELIKPAVSGTLNVLRAARKAGVKRVVLTSSCASIMGSYNEPMDRAYTEKDWSDTKNPHLQVYNKSKTLAERAAWDFVKDGGPDLVTINPGFVVGPVLCGAVGTSIDLIKQILERAMPMVPNVNIVVCDVRDVAKAHVVALTSPGALNERHIISSKEMWFVEIAKVISDEFSSQGYNVPTKTVPNFVIGIMSLFDQQAKATKPMLGKVKKVDNSRMVNILGIEPSDMKSCIIDMCYSMIEKGFVKKTPKYRGVMSRK